MTRYHEGLQCDVQRLTYDFDQRTGVLEMGADSCCDMDGCLNVFMAIDPEVRVIRTYAGGRPDTVYSLSESGEWTAR